MPSTQIPGPAGSRLLGSLPELRRGALDVFRDAQREHGDVVRFVVGPRRIGKEMFCVFSAEAAQQILATDVANFRKDSTFYEEVRQTAGNGLLTSQDEDYKRQRRLVQPLFTQRRVAEYGAQIVEEAAGVLAGWRKAPDATVDVVEQMAELTLRSTVRILFGADFDVALDTMVRTFGVTSDYVRRRSFALIRTPRGWPTPANRRAAAAAAEMYEVCDRIIAERRRDGVRTHDLLTQLVQAQNAEDGRLDATEVRDQVLVFLLAGAETTGTSLAMALHLMATHPHVQRKAREEVRRVLGARTPESGDYERLPYLAMIFKEAVRLYPAGAFFTRKAVNAADIGGYTIPAGADVIGAPWVIHRHPRYWQDPDRFDPERFAPEQEKERHRYAWIPFGGGPRACIGRHFAMLEAVLALAMILRDYGLEPVDRDVTVTMGVTLQTEGPVRCRVRPIPPEQRKQQTQSSNAATPREQREQPELHEDHEQNPQAVPRPASGQCPVVHT
ncbi:MAG: cytochrome P450 [Actinocrinis sp.]